MMKRLEASMRRQTELKYEIEELRKVNSKKDQILSGSMLPDVLQVRKFNYVIDDT